MAEEQAGIGGANQRELELARFMWALAELESGGTHSYSIRGPMVQSGMYAGERAYGRYQIMPGNWRGWAAEAGIPGADISDPAAQDRVAAFKLRQYYEQFGSWDLAAIAWFAGPGRAEDAKRDGIGSLAGVSDSYTAVPDYVQTVRRNMERAPDDPGFAWEGLPGGGVGPGSASPQQPTVSNPSNPDPTALSGTAIGMEAGVGQPAPDSDEPSPPPPSAKQPQTIDLTGSRLVAGEVQPGDPADFDPSRFPHAGLAAGLLQAMSDTIRRASGWDPDEAARRTDYDLTT